jgi:hypothetical protein
MVKVLLGAVPTLLRAQPFFRLRSLGFDDGPLRLFRPDCNGWGEQARSIICGVQAKLRSTVQEAVKV